MDIGNGMYKTLKWKLGKLTIDSCDAYKYLGDIIMRNGKNTKNIEEREMKTMATTRKIISLCSSDIFKKGHLRSLIKLHNSCTVAGLLTNCETWVLNKGERSKIERIELWALKTTFKPPQNNAFSCYLAHQWCLNNDSID